MEHKLDRQKEAYEFDKMPQPTERDILDGALDDPIAFIMQRQKEREEKLKKAKGLV